MNVADCCRVRPLKAEHILLKEKPPRLKGAAAINVRSGSGGSHCEGAGLLFPISSETDTGKSEKHHRPSRWLRYCGHAVFGYRDGREMGRKVLKIRSDLQSISPIWDIVGINCMRKRGRDRCEQ